MTVRSAVPAAQFREDLRARLLLVGALIVFGAFSVYWSSYSVPFFFDDPASITENPTIQNLSALGEVLTPPRNGSGVTGRPLVNLSLAINYALGGTAVTGYHLLNVLLHACAGLALFGIVRRTLLMPDLEARFGRSSLLLGSIV